MSTQSVSPAAPGILDISGTAPIPLSRLIKVELRKAWDTRAGLWLLVTIGLLAVIAQVIALLISVLGSPSPAYTYNTFVGVTSFVVGILLPILGIMLVTGEWGQRTAMVTFTLVPERGRIVLAKLLVGLILGLVAIVVALVVGVICNGLNGLFTGDSTWNAEFGQLLGFTILQEIGMLLGFMLGAMFLNTAVAIVVFFAYTWVLPILFAVGSNAIHWFSKIQPWIDFSSAQGPIAEWDVHGKDWAHLLVSGFIWLVIPLCVGLWRILRAEVK